MLRQFWVNVGSSPCIHPFPSLTTNHLPKKLTQVSLRQTNIYGPKLIWCLATKRVWLESCGSTAYWKKLMPKRSSFSHWVWRNSRANNTHSIKSFQTESRTCRIARILMSGHTHLFWCTHYSVRRGVTEYPPQKKTKLNTWRSWLKPSTHVPRQG